MEKVTYTPAEFAEVFGKERTWGYRQLYKGKVNAITELGRTLIPKSEVDRLLKEAGRYLGAKTKTGKEVSPPAGKVEEKKASSQNWRDAVKRRREGAGKKNDSKAKKENGAEGGTDKHSKPQDPQRFVGLRKFDRGSR